MDGNSLLPSLLLSTSGWRVFPSITNGALYGSSLTLDALGLMVPCSGLQRLVINTGAEGTI
jgi:hypothetical protein